MWSLLCWRLLVEQGGNSFLFGIGVFLSLVLYLLHELVHLPELLIWEPISMRKDMESLNLPLILSIFA
jgi:hypothetical protein